MPESVIVNLADYVTEGMLYIPPDYPDRVESFIPSPGHYRHAATLIELENGDLLCTWMAGHLEGAPDLKIYLSRLDSGSAAWSEPIRITDDYTRSEQNPAIFKDTDGTLWLSYTSLESRGCTRDEWEAQVPNHESEEGNNYIMSWTALVEFRTSHDNGVSWSEKSTFSSDTGLWSRYPIKELSNGDWIFPVYQRTTEHVMKTDYTRMMISEDKGHTWSEYPIPDGRGKVHASIVEVSPGRLRAFFRSRFKDYIYVADSGDYGRTWTKPEPTVLPNNNSSITVIKLQDGSLCASYNHSNDKRVPVTLALSEDDGVSWPYMRHLETGDNFCGEKNSRFNKSFGYPLVYQTRNGYLHIVHSYANSMHPVKYARITEEWIRGSVSTSIARPAK